MTAGAATPLWLLTGFLGSGKTTLLARLLRNPALRDTAVVVNEFGEVGLDHRLVATAEEDNVLLLENGCLCCDASNGLGEALDDLYYRRARGGAGFTRVIVETTGLADPGPIVAGLIGDRHRAARFPLAGLIAMVDADQGLDRIARFPEAARQVAVADRIVVSKLDLTGGVVPPALAATLLRLNPNAARLLARHGEVDPDRLLAPADPAGFAATAPEGHAAHSEISTRFLPLPDPLGGDEYGRLLVALAALGPGLLRTKGLLRLQGEAHPVVIQGVGQLFAEPAALPGAAGRFGLVLIGEGLDDAAVDRVSRSLRPGAAPPGS